MSVVFTFIFVLEVSLPHIIPCVFDFFFISAFVHKHLIDRCSGNHEADSHVASRLLAEQAESLRPAGHIAGCHLDRPALLTTG